VTKQAWSVRCLALGSLIFHEMKEASSDTTKTDE